jgi:hypothetical protein
MPKLSSLKAGDEITEQQQLRQTQQTNQNDISVLGAGMAVIKGTRGSVIVSSNISNLPAPIMEGMVLQVFSDVAGRLFWDCDYTRITV